MQMVFLGFSSFCAMMLKTHPPSEKPSSYLLLDQKVTKNQGCIKIWLKADSIPLNKKRPRVAHFIEVGFARRLLFVLTAPPLHRG